MTEEQPQKVDFFKTIHDNVHGNIQLTEVEFNVIQSLAFQRLRNIKQLGLSDYVFPGAIHNRFSHSLGVMHIADMMVVSLQKKGQFLHNDKVREKCRMAGLLHDIGHYPWSHIIEHVVNTDAKNHIKRINPEPITIQIEEQGVSTEKEQITTKNYQWSTELENSDSHQLNKNINFRRNDRSDFAHHERMASIVIKKTPINGILLDSGIFNESDIDEIAQIIAGSKDHPERLIIHSELDADRFDYLLRDSRNTGVTYGLFDMSRIIQYLDYSDTLEPVEGTTGILVHKKAQKAVEDFLMARYFLYSTVIFQKTTTGFHELASIIYKGLLERGNVYSYIDLIRTFDRGELASYYTYDDNYLMQIINDIVSNKIQLEDSDEHCYSSKYIKKCCEKLLHRDPLKLVIEKQQIYEKTSDMPDYIKLFEDPGRREILKSANIDTNWYITSIIDQEITSISPYIIQNEDCKYDEIKAEAIRIFDKKSNTTKLLVDDEASIIKELCKYKLNIAGIYTLDDEHSGKIITAISEYEKQNPELT